MDIWTGYVIPIGCGVTPILLAGAGALLRVCRRFDRIEEQNALQSQQLAALSRALEQLQAWALGRSAEDRLATANDRNSSASDPAGWPHR